MGKKIDPRNIKFYIFTVSTSRFKALEHNEKIEDVSGTIAKEILEKSRFKVIGKEIIKDGVFYVKEALKKGIREGADFVLFIGGSGATETDMTAETLDPLLDKKLIGFGEGFRRKSEEKIGTKAYLTNSYVGVLDKTIIVCLPGSPDGVKFAIEEILLPEVFHLYKLVKYGHH